MVATAGAEGCGRRGCFEVAAFAGGGSRGRDRFPRLRSDSRFRRLDSRLRHHHGSEDWPHHDRASHRSGCHRAARHLAALRRGRVAPRLRFRRRGRGLGRRCPVPPRDPDRPPHRHASHRADHPGPIGRRSFAALLRRLAGGRRGDEDSRLPAASDADPRTRCSARSRTDWRHGRTEHQRLVVVPAGLGQRAAHGRHGPQSVPHLRGESAGEHGCPAVPASVPDDPGAAEERADSRARGAGRGRCLLGTRGRFAGKVSAHVAPRSRAVAGRGRRGVAHRRADPARAVEPAPRHRVLRRAFRELVRFACRRRAVARRRTALAASTRDHSHVRPGSHRRRLAPRRWRWRRGRHSRRGGRGLQGRHQGRTGVDRRPADRRRDAAHANRDLRRRQDELHDHADG